jgi:hypothetical protein
LTDAEKKAAGAVVDDLFVRQASADGKSVAEAIEAKNNGIQAAEAEMADGEVQSEEAKTDIESADAEARARRKELEEEQTKHQAAQAQQAAEPTPQHEVALNEAAARLTEAHAASTKADEALTGFTAQQEAAQQRTKEARDKIQTLEADIEQLRAREQQLASTVEHGAKAAKDLTAGGALTVRRLGDEEPMYELLAENVAYTLTGERADRVLTLLPTIVMISSQDLLEQRVSLSELEGEETQHRAMRSLLQLGRIDDVSELSDPDRRSKLLWQAEERVARFVRERWTQDTTVGVRLDSDGQTIDLNFTDETGVVVPPDRRSPGFLEHVSLHLVLLARRTPDDLKGCIILADELGIRLHPKGQRDLLAILEDLATDNQVIYTTHSPFMIDRNFPDRILLVEKDRDTRTRVNAKPYLERWAPLRSALGLALGDSLVFGEKNVLVEGAADQLILTAFAQALRRLGVQTVDLNQTNFVPVGGASSMVSVAKLIEGYEELKWLALLDSDDEGYKVQRRFEQHKLGLDRVLLAGDVVEAARVVTVEDLVPHEVYLNAVKTCYDRLDMGDWVPEALLEDRPILQALSAALQDADLGDFDKIGVAAEVARQLREDPRSALDRTKDDPEQQPAARLLRAAAQLLAGVSRHRVQKECRFVDNSVHAKRSEHIKRMRQQGPSTTGKAPQTEPKPPAQQEASSG